jgi:hypothetical protein
MIMEALPEYSEVQRDRLEEQLAAEANKLELDSRHSNGITVIAYWLKAENQCLIFVHDERTDSACEFVVSNDEVYEWFNHPFANKDCVMPAYGQSQNGEQV